MTDYLLTVHDEMPVDNIVIYLNVVELISHFMMAEFNIVDFLDQELGCADQDR